MLERESELAAIDAWVTAAPEGGGGVLVIEGPPGIGKTALLRAGREEARARGVEVLSALGGELEREFPFGLVRQVFERRVLTSPPDERARLFAGAARLAEPVLAADAHAGGPRAVDPVEGTLHGLYWLAANLAAERPLAIVVDDAHWADAASLRWLAYLGRRLEGVPIAVAIATRPDAGAPCRQMLTALAPVARVLMPEPLGVEATASLVAGVLGRPADEFAAACHSVTGGNPLLVRELADALAAEGVSPSASAAAHVGEAGPVAVARILAGRLASLPATALPLLRAVAVGGTSVGLDQAAAVAQLDVDAAAAIADRLAAINVLQPGRPLALVHPIVRTVLLRDVPPAELDRLHMRSARHLAATGATAVEVATHLLATTPRADEWVTDVLRSAARSAVADGAPEAALEYLRRARVEPPPPDRRGKVLLELGRAAVAARDPAAAEHLRDALEAAPDDRRRADVAVELGRALMLSARLEEAVRVLDAERARVDGCDHERATRLELELVGAARVDLALRPLVAERLERLRRYASEPTVGELYRAVLANLAFEAGLAGDVAARVAALAERALANGQLLAEQTALSPVYYLAANALSFADRLEAARAALDDAVIDARSRGSLVGFAIASCYRSRVNLLLGALVDAEADASASLEIAREHGWELGLPASLAFLIDALLERGDVAGAERALAAAGIGAELPNDVHGNLLLFSRAQLYGAQGDARRSLEDLLECGRRQEQWMSPNPAVVHWRSAAALAAARLGDTERGRRLADEELELSRSFGAPRAVGLALRVSGLLTGGDHGLRLLRESVDVLERSAAALELCKSLTHLGAALRRSGRPEAARAPLRRGLDLAQRLGARTLEAHALDELRAAGAKPRRRMLTGLDALTASERRTADMAASGMTNREIAQALFVTIKTVEGHLRGAFLKLGIRSRADLPALLADRHGIQRLVDRPQGVI